MMAGSNETDHAWQDEGLATFAEDLSVADRFAGTDPFAATQQSYLSIAGSDRELPIETRADLFGPGPQYGAATYNKPGTLLRALGEVIGADTLDRALREYTSRWNLRHPSPFDFFHTIEDVAGRDLDWFWSAWWFDTVTLDHAIVAVDVMDLAEGGERVAITVEDQGDAAMPVPLAVTLESGEMRTLRLPVEPWIEGRTRQRATIDVDARVTRVEIDPEEAFPDIDRRDNVWTRPNPEG
jgi:aminopeptidase N